MSDFNTPFEFFNKLFCLFNTQYADIAAECDPRDIVDDPQLSSELRRQ